jgi:hypothetical protein
VVDTVGSGKVTLCLADGEPLNAGEMIDEDYLELG